MASIATLPLLRLPTVAENLAFVSSTRLGRLQLLPLLTSSSSSPSLQASFTIGAAAAGAAVIADANKPKIVEKNAVPRSSQSKPSSIQNLPVQRIIRERKASATKPPRFSKAARRFYNETFREPQRLSKVLAAAGVASRRSCEELIFEAKVAVNGEICTVPQTMVDPLKDSIYVNGRSLPKKLAPKLYFVLNKPKGYICSNGEKDDKCVLTLLDDYMKIWVQRNPGIPKPRLFTVGRLDVSTTGLLFVTNDGEFAHNVSHPSSGLTKEYIVTVEGKITKRQVQTLLDGAVVQGVQCVPNFVELIDGEQGDSKTRIKIVVYTSGRLLVVLVLFRFPNVVLMSQVSEGRNHEVRYIVENAGLEVGSVGVQIKKYFGGFLLGLSINIGKGSVGDVSVEAIFITEVSNRIIFAAEETTVYWL